VAAELEARWNRALLRVGELEAKIAAHDDATPPLTALPLAALATLTDDLAAAWRAPTTDARLKKRIVRTVIREVIADIDAEGGAIVLLIH
jgi:L-asparaginase II